MAKTKAKPVAGETIQKGTSEYAYDSENVARRFKITREAFRLAFAKKKPVAEAAA